MKRLMISLAALAAIAAACSGGSGDPGPNPTATPTPSNVVDVTANITADTTWTADKVYVLKNHIFVESGTLTIQPGTLIKGDLGSSLVITKNAKINAVGSVAAPIVFTSSKPAGTRAPGDWGGVLLLGKATINPTAGTQPIEGFPTSYGDLITYGGTDDAHDCGDLSFARIEYAGFEIAVDSELNGLSVGACGSATNIDYVQVHLGSDDGVEMFGGTANLKHIVISQADDDGLDWDFGWRGKVQFLVIQQSATQGNMAMECDNNGSANDALPRSNPTIYNVTVIGSDAAPGTAGATQRLHLRRGTAGKIYNMIMTKMADGHIDVDGAATVAQATGGELLVANSILFDNGNTNETWPAEATDNDAGFDENAYFAGATLANRFVDPQFTSNAFNLGAPDFRPSMAGPASTGAATPPNDGFFDAGATYVGAMGATDWTSGWTSYPAN